MLLSPYCTTGFRLSCLLLAAMTGGRLSAADLPDYEQEIRPILIDRCGGCHGVEQQEADVRFDLLSTDLVRDRAAAETWHEARHAINAGEMPPEDAPRLTVQERELVLRWISGTIEAAISTQRSTSGRVVLRRLNNDEYQNTMFDLLGYDTDYTLDLPPDSLSPEGFRNHGQSLRMSAMQIECYLRAARRALAKVIVSGPPPKVFRHRFDQSNVNGWRGPTEMSNRLERAQKFLAKMVDDYPDEGQFAVRVQLQAVLRPDKGCPILEAAVGYRPDTEVHFRVAGAREIYSPSVQQLEFRGQLENFPLPVRGQGKYPGLVVRLRNVYDDGTEPPRTLNKVVRDGKEVDAFAEEPNLPHLEIKSVEFEAPVYAEWPPRLHTRILFESALRTKDESAYAAEVIQRFMRRAFRRPVAANELQEAVAFYESVRPDVADLEEAIRETLALILIQPDFLYLMETGGNKKRTIDDWELASRLSYFLWNTMPDQRLFDLADSGVLHDPTVLRGQVRRMLANPRAERMVSQFVSEWLRLGGLDTIAIDPEYYPDFDERLKADMRQETIAYFTELLQTGDSAVLLLQSNFTMMNEPLARHYGVGGVFGQSFRRVQINSTERPGGLLGHASVFLVNSNGQDSHPIRRAVWVRDRLLGDPPAPPPPDVPDLDEADPEFARLSVREQLAVHRSKESCASCHRKLDPWGIALENFDAIGLYRESVRRKAGDVFETRPVSAADELPDGTVLCGATGLADYLVQHRTDQFAGTLVRNLTTYALGRSLELSDEEDLAKLMTQFAESGYQLQTLVEQIVLSQPFSTK